jgi:hypothetical protein
MVAVLSLVALAGPVPSAAGSPAGAAVVSALTVRVDGNHLVDASGHTLRLLGVDRDGTEFSCVGGTGIFSGPSSEDSVRVIASWGANAVRVPLNEDCWLGINGVKKADSGRAYRTAIEHYVTTLHRAGLVVILDLHWNAPGSIVAGAQHAPTFWTSVATVFRSDHSVVFDLYNEPHGISWSCWLHGCRVSGVCLSAGNCTNGPAWQTAGMQSLVDAVRSTGATQPLMLGGLDYSNNLSGWLKYEPHDPLHQLIASVHVYQGALQRLSYWQSDYRPVLKKVPIVTGELGEFDCADGFVDPYMRWADQHGVSYLAWAWLAGGGATCTGGPTLITNYAGSPTGFGVGIRDHLLSLLR